MNKSEETGYSKKLSLTGPCLEQMFHRDDGRTFPSIIMTFITKQLAYIDKTALLSEQSLGHHQHEP
jgi:hypothetical protein